MASRGALAARSATASGTIDQNMQRIAEKLKIDVPAAPVIPTRQPEIKSAVQMERLAGFLQAVADAVGAKPLEETDPQGPADGGAIPPPAENEPPHTQTVTPLASATINPPDADSEGDGEQPEGADEPHFAGRPLSSFDSVPDDKLTDEEHVGKVTARKIVRARKRRDAKK